MLIFCEECGKRYSFPPEKVEPGSNKFRCRACNFLMTVNCPSEDTEKKPESSEDDTVQKD